MASNAPRPMPQSAQSAEPLCESSLCSIPSHHGDAHNTLLDHSVADMKAYLDEMQPATTSAALHQLRDEFPSVPLEQRVAACEAYVSLLR